MFFQMQVRPCEECLARSLLLVGPDLALYAVQLQSFLGIIDATKNLTLATLNATANTPALEGSPVSGMIGSSEGSPGGPGGVGPGGPGGGGPGRDGPPPRGPPPQFEAFGCSDEGFKATSNLMKQGFSTAVTTMGYDESLFSFVGCRCDAGYDNIYTISETGVAGCLNLCLPEHELQCITSAVAVSVCFALQLASELACSTSHSACKAVWTATLNN